ncbi:hypothetical protein BV881_14265 [Streptomyces sp. ZL-24]|nr:hypothetical protein BV881_14265 [Streptomyces sp. ZL-24]
MGGCACGGLVPLPAPSRNRGSAPDPAPQAPEGLIGAGRSARTPLLKRRRGGIRVGGIRCCGFSWLLRRRPCPAAPSVRRR